MTRLLKIFALHCLMLLPFLVTQNGCSGAVSSVFGEPIQLTEPGVLDRKNASYVLAGDIVAPGTAFIIRESGITLDLNGHTIRYGEKDAKEAFGILIEGYHRRDIRLLNGIIVQGDGNCSGNKHSIGCNPVYIPSGVKNLEVAHLDITYASSSTSGIQMMWGGESDIHHNVLKDLGTELGNRHQGAAVIEAHRGEKMSVHHNRIARARHIGIRVGEEGSIYDNEIHLDSCATNSTGISAAGGLIRRNRITGEGIHPIGIWPGNNILVEDNYVEVQSTRPGEEYGSTGAACLRMTWGNDNVRVRGNTFILHAGGEGEKGFSSWGRALWVGLPDPGQKAVFENNRIVALNSDGKSIAAAIAVVCNNASPDLIFRNNTVVSNWGNVLLSDKYGHADGYPRFVGNRFVRKGTDDTYRTIRSRYSSRPSTGIFIGNTYVGGASRESLDLEFHGSGKREVGFGRFIDIEVTDATDRPVPEARVQISNGEGRTISSGKTDGTGRFRAEVVDYFLTNENGQKRNGRADPTENPVRRAESPFSVVVEKDGKRVSQTFDDSIPSDFSIPLEDKE